VNKVLKKTINDKKIKIYSWLHVIKLDILNVMYEPTDQLNVDKLRLL